MLVSIDVSSLPKPQEWDISDTKRVHYLLLVLHLSCPGFCDIGTLQLTSQWLHNCLQ